MRSTSVGQTSPAPAARGPRRLARAGFLAAGAAAALLAAPLTAHADVIGNLPYGAGGWEASFSPAYDYDGDGCLATSAEDINGNLNPGLALGGAVNGHCHDMAQLNSSNTYGRSECNNGWCAVMYDSYFEKDQSTNGVGEIAGGTNGHRHDIESVISWINQASNQVEYLSVSQHGDWKTYTRSQVRFDGSHPKVVYQKDGGFTHDFRIANASDDAVENPTHQWFYPPLVDWNHWPQVNAPTNWLRDRLMAADFGSASFKIKDSAFQGELGRAKPLEISFQP
ncbi:NPP1 family protein [Streptomyces liangshanensis]|uniref:Necrosis inducing protein (NPP1) n=1 Tax=Streptomyces liangshanensis TaxID=2717324 RepID=A0A6G9GVM3_9ACTN|nr:NPP1 family protein [Streptomyces liangshanensis]QIQ02126.1 hypothetical protein HA039_07275 [Streptomyces liangshanensis]